MPRVVNVVGARPNFVKMAPLLARMREDEAFSPLLVHTGQHYDASLSGNIFEDLGLSPPDLNLGVGSASHARQTARVMVRFEEVLERERADLVVVVGDVNSTLACALVAAKRGVPVAHVEAGLRSFDRRMPEEVNRVLTDALSDFLFTPSADANTNLMAEGIPAGRIHLVGNIMIDTLVRLESACEGSSALERLGVASTPFGLLTLHRPSNVDDPGVLGGILGALEELQRRIPLVFPVHPRTRTMLRRHGFERRLAGCDGLILTEPLRYRDCLQLMRHARLVLTDSGGVQEETTYLGVPCLTLRENTERPLTLHEGTNILVGTRRERIVEESLKILEGQCKVGRRPLYWDGKTAERIVTILRRALAPR